MKINQTYAKYAGTNKLPKHNNGINNPCIGVSEISFSGADAATLVSKIGDTVTYGKINDAIDCIDKILGSGYLTSKIKAAGLGDKLGNGTLTLKSTGILSSAFSAIKYPFVDLPFDLINFTCKGLHKTPLRTIGDRVLENGFIKGQLGRIEKEKSYELVSKIFEQFFENYECYGGKNQLGKLAENFSINTANKITKTAKAYASRDERTINRLVTGGIAAFLSGIDHYNISMYEKNDKKTAKKAQNERCKQEATRVGLSAGLTFLLLGAFSKYNKAAPWLIMTSTLISEVISRLVNHKSLTWISPEKAAEIAKKRKENQPISYSGERNYPNTIKQNHKSELYKDFIRPSDNNKKVAEFASEPINNKKTKKNKFSLLAIAGIAAAACSVFYIISRNVKGIPDKNAAIRKLYEQYGSKIEDCLNNAEKLNLKENEDLIQLINQLSGDKKNIAEAYKNLLGDKKCIAPRVNEFFRSAVGFIKERIKEPIEGSEIFKSLKGMIDELTKDKTEFKLSKLQELIGDLEKKDGQKEVKSLLEVYKNEIESLEKNGISQIKFSNSKQYVQVLKSGLTKVFGALYKIFSLPGFAIAKISDYLKFGPITNIKNGKRFTEIFKYDVNPEKKFEQINKLLDLNNSERLNKMYEKQLGQLFTLFKEAGVDSEEKIIPILKNHARNFENSTETGELANFSRTLVTLVASIFYIGDFRNAVLVESEGKNTQRADEVTKDCAMFKLCNLLFNGALMNLFNTVFKKQLNGSLLGAAIVPAATEVCNEILIRKTISRPMNKMSSRDEMIEFERYQANKKGIAGWWTRTYKKLTGGKSLIEKSEAKKAK